jgi:hypothetical protein
MKPDLSHANKLNMDVFVPALVFGALVSKDFRSANTCRCCSRPW